MKNLLIAFILCLGISAAAQHRVGVRAGLNYSKFSGPLEVGESYDITGGFHFGINYTYEFNDVFGLRAEILYTQRGTEQTYLDSSSYYIINPISPSQSPTVISNGTVDYNIKISNATLSIPVTANYRISRKFEVFGGASLDFVIGPTGRGKVQFEHPTDSNLIFTESFDHKYNSDVPGQYNTFLPLQDNVQVELNGERVFLPRIIGAYYNYPFLPADEDMPSRINSFDANLIAGVNYYINSGFYLGARLEYGLLDTTNDVIDKSLKSLDEDNNYIFREDSDKSIGVAISFGFKF
jgi:opacity protein-like surface antigen